MIPNLLPEARIKAKQLRYAAEAATPIVGKSARKFATATETVQGDLGEHHDAVAAQAWLRRQVTTSTNDGGLPTTAAAFDAGPVAATQRARQRK